MTVNIYPIKKRRVPNVLNSRAIPMHSYFLRSRAAQDVADIEHYQSIAKFLHDHGDIDIHYKRRRALLDEYMNEMISVLCDGSFYYSPEVRSNLYAKAPSDLTPAELYLLLTSIEWLPVARNMLGPHGKKKYAYENTPHWDPRLAAFFLPKLCRHNEVIECLIDIDYNLAYLLEYLNDAYVYFLNEGNSERDSAAQAFHVYCDDFGEDWGEYFR